MLDLADLMQPGDGAVRLHDAVLEGKGLRLGPRLGVYGLHPFPVLGVNEAQKVLGGGRQSRQPPPHDLARRLRPNHRLRAWLLAPEGDLGPPGGIGDLGSRFREVRLALPLLGDVEIDPEQAGRPAELIEGAGAEVAEKPAPAASLAPNAVFNLVIRP